jgi:CheY-like chemotaxis protein
MMSERPSVLCVDDEPAVLDGLRLTLRRQFEVTTAESADTALALLREGKIFSVIISDMRMPKKDGAAFLSEARQLAPAAVRMLLTGDADISAARSAVNEGQIFRFLSKPCAPDALVAATLAASVKCERDNAEKLLLEQTLGGAIRVLTDVLSLAQPLAFGRATRIKALVSAFARHRGITDLWALEVAAALAELSATSLPTDLLERAYRGETLVAADALLVRNVPLESSKLIAHIPRLDEVIAILAAPPDSTNDKVLILRIVSAFDWLEMLGRTVGEAEQELLASFAKAQELVRAVCGFVRATRERSAIVEITLAQLMPGHVLEKDVTGRNGNLLLARGHTMTSSLIQRLRQFSLGAGVSEPLCVRIPS